MFCRLCGKVSAGKKCMYCGTASGNVSIGIGGNSKPEIVMESEGRMVVGNDYTTETVQMPVVQTNSQQKQSNGLAIAGFILSLFSPTFLIGFILSIVGLVKSRDMNGSGKGLAIAGVVLSSIVMLGVIVSIVFNIIHI